MYFSNDCKFKWFIIITKFEYKLLSDAFSGKDINAGINVLKSRQLTMSKITENFEKIFATKMGCKYAVMVNSGSSANLLALSAIINPLFKKKLKKIKIKKFTPQSSILV